MKYIEYTKRLEYLLELIQKEQLSTPSELALKFTCSEKTIRNMINVLRLNGYKIKYSKGARKYFIQKK